MQATDIMNTSHIMSCFAANTLLLLQHHFLCYLVPDVAHEIDKKIYTLMSDF